MVLVLSRAIINAFAWTIVTHRVRTGSQTADAIHFAARGELF